ncbi:MAG: response regulator [Bacteroidetes bacterium]|nr:response regulator [Bacteroidota bacterium]
MVNNDYSELKILVVDDDLEYTRIAEHLLKKKDYQVRTAHCGEDCLKAVRQDKPDLLLLDVMLPDISGVEVCDIIKNDPGLSSIHVILLSGLKTQSDNISKGLETGADGYLVKPIDNMEFLARIDAAFRTINAKKALLESEKRSKLSSSQFEAILDHLPALVFYKDRSNRFIRVNKYLAEAYNKSKKELEGVSLYDIYPQDVAEQYHQDDLEVLNSGLAKLNISEPWQTPEGLRWVRTSKIPFVNQVGEIDGVIGISIDITDLKHAEEEISSKNIELLKTIAEKDKFFSIIAHDLRSPFNTFLGMTRLMVKDLHTLKLDEIQKMAFSMRNSATTLFRLLENLLAWSGMKRGLISFEPGTFHVLPKIAESIQPVMEAANIKNIGINFDISNELNVYADAEMFSTTIRNLVFNAVKFTPAYGKIIILAKPAPGNFVEISVKDTGIGMSSELLSNLFRIDVQTNRKGTEGEPSTGLGLLLCKEFIEKQGGRLWVESEEAKGSTFHFTVPQSHS